MKVWHSRISAPQKDYNLVRVADGLLLNVRNAAYLLIRCQRTLEQLPVVLMSIDVSGKAELFGCVELCEHARQVEISQCSWDSTRLDHAMIGHVA